MRDDAELIITDFVQARARNMQDTGLLKELGHAGCPVLIKRGLAAVEAAPPDAERTDIVSIGLACALGYLDWRRPVDWRPACPRLVAWLAAFARHEPAYDATRAEAAA